ncbi:hypothetical protein Tco_1125296, partial [Tanacetum coccineum]
TLGGSEGGSFWEGGDDFGVDVLRFHTCLTDILGFLEKLERWFEQRDMMMEGEEGRRKSKVVVKKLITLQDKGLRSIQSNNPNKRYRLVWKTLNKKKLNYAISTLGCNHKYGLEIDEDDLEELDLRWHVAMLTVRVKKFIQNTGRNMDFKEKRHVSLDKSKIECYNYHRKWHFARECISGRNQGRRSYGDNG